MNLSEIRNRHPLAFVVLATLITVVCFTIIPTTSLWWVLAQTAVAALCMILLLALTEPHLLAFPHVRKSAALTATEVRNKKSVYFVTALLLANALFVGITAALSLSGVLPRGEYSAPVGTSLASPISFGVFLVVCIATGIFEEGLFRGIISRGFSDALQMDGNRSHALVGAIASAVLFGLLHTADAPSLDFVGGVVIAQFIVKTTQAMLFGFVLSALLFRLDNLWLVAALHAGFNMLSMGPVFALTGEMPTTYLTGNPFDLVVVVASVALLVPLAVHAWRILAPYCPTHTT